MTDTTSLKSIAFFATLSIVGVALVYGSRALPKHDDEWKWVFWWREFVSGPPGYQRAIVILLGSVLIFAGAIGIIITIVS